MYGKELLNTSFSEVEHSAEFRTGVGLFFCGCLGLDETARSEHDDVHVHGGSRVLLIGEIEEKVAVDDADRGGGDHLAQGGGFEGASGDQLVERDGEGDGGAGDGGGASAAISLQNVAVKDDRALAESFHIDDGAKAATDEALNLVRAATDLPSLAFACGAGEGGAGKHAVLCGDPAPAGVAQPTGNSLFYGCVAEDARVADLDEGGPFSGADVVWNDGRSTKRVGGAMVWTKDGRGDRDRAHTAIIGVWVRLDPKARDPFFVILGLFKKAECAGDGRRSSENHSASERAAAD